MRLAEIKGGIVTNVIDVDPNAIPAIFVDFPDAGEAGPGWTYDGTDFAPPPARTSQEIDADLGKIADDILANDRALKAMGEMLFQVAKAAKTGDFSYFATVTNKATFRALFIEILRAG